MKMSDAHPFVVHTSSDQPRSLLLALFLTLLVAASLLLSVVAVAQTPNTAPPPPYPALGKLVDLGGWRLHIHCTGEAGASQPTVILEAGAGDFSVDWSLLQPRVARFARVCSYDRAGSGWSDLGPRPRTMHQIVWELHALLGKASVPPPYVLVGHSYGGLLVRLYAATYPSEVSGIVLEESADERGVFVIKDGKGVALVDTATRKPIPPVKTIGPFRESDVPLGRIRDVIEAAAREGPAHANDPPYNKLPREAQRMRTWALAQFKTYAANDNPFAAEELAALLAERKKKEPSLGNMPLTVLSRGLPEDERPGGQEGEDAHNRFQADNARLSSVGKQVIAKHSRHHICIDQPDLEASSIREILDAARKYKLPF
jgi:pimeloyl-ACP methyl ester carboxylesterase